MVQNSDKNYIHDREFLKNLRPEDEGHFQGYQIKKCKLKTNLGSSPQTQKRLFGFFSLSLFANYTLERQKSYESTSFARFSIVRWISCRAFWYNTCSCFWFFATIVFVIWKLTATNSCPICGCKRMAKKLHTWDHVLCQFGITTTYETKVGFFI